MTARRRRGLVATALVLSLVAAACGSDDKSDSGAAATTAAPAASTGDSTAAPTETTAAGGAETTAVAGDQEFAGEKVTVFGSIRDPEDAQLAAAWKDFETRTGVDIEYEGSGSFEDDLKLRVEGGNAPDLALVPQPGLFATLARDGKLVPLSDLEADVKANDIGGWLDYGSVDGTFYGPPFSANIKSLVWYSPAAFADKGYEVPTTWQAMVDLSDKIVADGGVPWCVGAESGGATGWVLTDWIEDAVLRSAGPEVYDKWVTHEIPFNDPAIVTAVDMVGDIVKNDDYVLNGAQSIPSTSFQEAGLPLLDGECLMHRQASFYSTFWTEGTTFGPEGDVNAFYLPTINEGDPQVMLGGGEIIGAFSDRPVVAAVAAYLSGKEYAENFHKLGYTRIFPRTDVDLSLIQDPLVKQFADLLVGSDVFRFDGSDLMPGAVGAGTFWTEIVEWVVGGKSTEEALTTIDESWPES